MFTEQSSLYLQTRKTIHLVPGNTASYLSSSVVITPGEIRVGPVIRFSKEIEVPIGTIVFTSTVVVTIGFNKSHFNQN